MENGNWDQAGLAEQLQGWFDLSANYVIAMSGGVDSSVGAYAASRAGARAIAMTARGPSVSRRDIDDASVVAKRMTIEHRWIEPAEHLSDDYRRNDVRRCYFCKSSLFHALRNEFPNATILTGTNADDLGDYRPGLEAASEAHVRSPLVELRFGKSQIRALARHWQIPVSEKPASPCLASRIAYGVEVTPQRLAMIEEAETIVRSLLQIDDCRVRMHENALARIEIVESAFPRAIEPEVRKRVVAELQRLGFLYVTFDLAGQRSGSLNLVMPTRRSQGAPEVHSQVRCTEQLERGSVLEGKKK